MNGSMIIQPLCLLTSGNVFQKFGTGSAEWLMITSLKAVSS